MKHAAIAILTSLAVLVAISSCATVPKEPLAPGEVRLLRMEAPDGGNFQMSVSYLVNFPFEADGHPEFSRACCYWAGDGPHCMKITRVTYGSEAEFQISVYPRPDTNKVECYAEYLMDGKKRRTNSVSTFITGFGR